MEETKMHKVNVSKASKGRLIFGLVLLLIGAGLILKQFDLIPDQFRDIIFTWQSFLIIIGIVMVAAREGRTTGFILIGVGIFFIIPDIIDVPYGYSRLIWALLLIILGLLIIFRTSLFRRSEDTGNDENFIDDLNIFGGHERKINSGSFRGGKITSVFGGGTYDLSYAQLAPGLHTLDMVNIFGGAKLIVPSDWDIKTEVVAIFGGFGDKRQNLPVLSEKTNKQLIIKGIAIFGGGEITSIKD
jgi:predicted membrane protein